jgi:hypothetical protein
LASVPQRGQVAKYGVEKKSVVRAKKAEDVLEQREAGSYIPKQSDALRPEVTFVLGTFSFAGKGMSLTGKSPCNDETSAVSLRDTCSLKQTISGELLNGSKVRHLGEAMSENCARVRVNLGEAYRPKASGLERQRESGDP